MQPPLTRPSLNRSALVGLLAELALVDHPPAPPSFVEGLAQWLGWKEAIPLSAALQVPAAATPRTRAAPDAHHGGTLTPIPTPNSTAQAIAAGAAADFQRVRQALENAIADTSSTAGEDGASFVPFRRRYANLQQAMDSAVGPLRQRMRQAVAQPASAERARLAALDSALADALAAREQSLLAQMPVLLEKHFTRLRQASTAATNTAPESAATPGPTARSAAARPLRQPSPAWLARFRRDMQRLLMAELDLRLQPALGLLDTLQAAPPDTLLS